MIIHVEGTDLQTKRKPQDFQWLREAMTREFPASYLPPLSNTETKPTDIEYIQGQLASFESFLQDCINSHELRRSEALEVFLMIPDYNQYTEAKKRVDSSLPKRDFRSNVARSRSFFESGSASELFDLEKLRLPSSRVTSSKYRQKSSFHPHSGTSTKATTTTLRRLEKVSTNLPNSLCS